MRVFSEANLSAWRASLESGLKDVATMADGGAVVNDGAPQPAQYVLSGGGKRLRGLLTCSVWSDLATGRARANELKPIGTAVAIEALHAASLIHDDLPALDDDDMRRGKPSCHKAFGEAAAILTADAIFGAALLRITSDLALSSDEQARISKIASRAWLDLCVGQQLDIRQQERVSSAGALTLTEREMMIKLKTGALFGAAAASGAVCAGVRDALIDQFRSWGVRVGECFQALDDLADGDRKESERKAIQDQCLAVKQAAHELDSRLASGVTISLVATILAV